MRAVERIRTLIWWIYCLCCSEYQVWVRRFTLLVKMWCPNQLCGCS